MKKFDGILFCTDLDGTLYDSQKMVSKENLDAIKFFKANGGKFTFITGRPPMISGDVCKLINPNAPFGCNNGGGIYDYNAQKYLWAQGLNNNVKALIDYIDQNMPDMGIQINTHNGIYFHKDNLAMQYFRKVTNTEHIALKHQQITEPILKVLFASTKEAEIEKLAALLKAHPLALEFDFIRSERILYEILPKGINKGVGLKNLAELLGAKTTVAVGDYDNDIEMLKSATIGYAVENATQNVKAVADRVTVSNNSHAIAAIVAELDKRFV